MHFRRISRRTMLLGTGAVTIGLPLLEEMLVSQSAAAAPGEVPVRAFNLFFGLGIPHRSSRKGLTACSNHCSH